MKTKLVLLWIAFLFTFIPCSKACTTFMLKNDQQVVYGRNFDFDFGSGFVVNNQRRLMKYALVETEKNIMTWESKYGSITFNQFGKEFPYGGMNEKGLVIEVLVLSQTKYPEIDNRKVISLLQWVQYQLDVSSTVAEVIASDRFVRISKENPIGLHFFVCDSKGNAATIEFLDGKMICHTGNELPIPLITNNTYDESISYLKNFNILGGDSIVKWDNFYDIDWSQGNTLAVNQIFAIAANQMIKNKENANLINSAFDVLQSVTVKNHTQWTTVFDMTNKMIYFKNNMHIDIVALDFKDFKFDSDKNTKILDIQTATSDKTMHQFIQYSTEINRDYVFKAYIPLLKSEFFPVRIPDFMIEAQARFPDTLKRVNKNND